MKKAFSMLEIVIVIMIIGVLAAISKEIIPDTTLLKDTSYLFSKLKEAQSNALLGESAKNCIDLNISKSDSIKKEEMTSKNPKKYFFDKKTKISIFGNVLKSEDKRLCFDENGRPYDSKIDLKYMIKKPFSIKVSYQKENKEMVIMPYSGFITIK